jgi:Lrp/AsnC family leucine-responsive transcriptional regulator
VTQTSGHLALDAIDLGLLGRLAREGRATWSDLGLEFGLTPPAVAARVRRLVSHGVIRQFAAWVAPGAVEAITAFVAVSFDDPDGHEAFRQAVGRLLAVQECHRVAGDAHYLLKVRARSGEELEHLLTTVLPSTARTALWRTMLVLRTLKESPVFPLPRIQPPDTPPAAREKARSR